MTFARLMLIAVMITVILDMGWSHFAPAPPKPEANFAQEAILDQTAPSPSRTIGAPSTVMMAEDEMKASTEEKTTHAFEMPALFSFKDDVLETTQEVSVQLHTLKKLVPSGGTGVKGAFYSFAHMAMDEADLFMQHVNTRWFRSDGSIDFEAVLEPPAGQKQFPDQPPMPLQPLK